jgi:ACS family hexuronate transporter-like MFS transporter
LGLEILRGAVTGLGNAGGDRIITTSADTIAHMRSPVPVRWVAITVFVFSAVLNYLDRQVLATMVTVWRAKPEFPFTLEDFGTLLAVFSLAYAISAPFMGFFLDRVGLNKGITISVTVWALASIGTGMVHGFIPLLICRSVLGVAEASGVSAVGKAVGLYLLPPERAVGTAMGQLGLSLGAGLAPKFAIYFAENYSWRYAFYAAGVMSLMWIPVWLATSRAIPPVADPHEEQHKASFALIRDPRIWAMIFANFTAMTLYSLWTNWSPTYLVKVHHLTPAEASHYSWVVPICGYLGALLGGSLSWRFIRNGATPLESRKKVCFICAVVSVGTVVIPWLPTPLLATIGMSLSYFWIGAWSTNMYTMPVDLYGAQRAAFGVSALVFAYGMMQAIFSKPIGYIIEQHGFIPICATFAFLPLVAQVALNLFVKMPAVHRHEPVLASVR